MEVALVTGLDVALRTDVAHARDALRAMLGDVRTTRGCPNARQKCRESASDKTRTAQNGLTVM
jgi:hypothetical protein